VIIRVTYYELLLVRDYWVRPVGDYQIVAYQYESQLTFIPHNNCEQAGRTGNGWDP